MVTVNRIKLEDRVTLSWGEQAFGDVFSDLCGFNYKERCSALCFLR